MDIFNFLISLFLLFPLISAVNTPSCPTAICFNSNFTIRFPFQAVPQAPPNCIYPGFNLSCDNEGNTVIRFPYSSGGDFFVRNIDYETQEIQLYDPSNCLPRRHLVLNLSATLFKISAYRTYTFMVCPTEFTQSRFAVIDCLSNSTNATLATSSSTLLERLTMCKLLVTLPIPVSGPMQYDSGITSQLNGDLQLYWDVLNCEECETQGATCGFENNTSQQVTCFANPEKGTADHLRLLKMISLTIAIPTIICAFCAACVCLVFGRRQSHGTTGLQNFDMAVTLQPPDTLISGLDQSTIESYTKVVLGESRRLPVGPNGGTCPICLSDYHAEEIVRCIPECQHCFHAGCIDAWLRLNNSCPVCRNSPSRAHVNLPSV